MNSLDLQKKVLNVSYIQEKVLNVNYIQEKGMYCDESTIATIANYYNLTYELCFQNTWLFSYYLKNQNDTSEIDFKIEIGNCEILAKKFIGLSYLHYKPANHNDKFNKILYEISNDRPVVVEFDNYYCPWATENEKKPEFYIKFIITGFDLINKLIYCIDVHYLKHVEKIPIDIFMKGCKEVFCVTCEQNCEDTDIHYVFRKNARQFIENKSYENLLKLADIFRNTINFISLDGTKINQSIMYQLQYDFEDLSRSRSLYLIFSRYVNEKYKIYNYKEFESTMSYSESKWNQIKLIVMKAYIKKDVGKDFNSKIAYIIEEIAHLEKKAANIVLNDNHKELPNSNNNNPISTTNFEISFLDLTKLLNNKGISNQNSFNADFTGLGEYIYLDELPDKNILVIEDKKFFIPNFCYSEKDNISCAGQVINVSEGKHSKIQILGCSEWGNFSDIIKIIFENNTEEEIFIGLTSWIRHIPYYNEHVAIRGTIINGNYTNEKKCSIYATECCIHNKNNLNIKQIILPFCEGMHIFAISLV